MVETVRDVRGRLIGVVNRTTRQWTRRQIPKTHKIEKTQTKRGLRQGTYDIERSFDSVEDIKRAIDKNVVQGDVIVKQAVGKPGGHGRPGRTRTKYVAYRARGPVSGLLRKKRGIPLAPISRVKDPGTIQKYYDILIREGEKEADRWLTKQRRVAAHHDIETAIPELEKSEQRAEERRERIAAAQREEREALAREAMEKFGVEVKSKVRRVRHKRVYVRPYGRTVKGRRQRVKGHYRRR